MEFHGWQQCQRKETASLGTLALLPPSWDTISAIYHEVVKFVSKFPYKKRLVLYFAYRGTTVKLDLGDGKLPDGARELEDALLFECQRKRTESDNRYTRFEDVPFPKKSASSASSKLACVYHFHLDPHLLIIII